MLGRRQLEQLQQQHKGKDDEKQVGHEWLQRLRLLVVVAEFWVTVFVVVVVGSLAVAVVVVDF